MVYKVILDTFFFPFTINLLSSCSMNIYAAHNKSEEKAFKRAIEESVNSVRDNISTELKKAIIRDIQDACMHLQEANIEKIVIREFKQWGEENANPEKVAAQICISLIEKINGIPGLRDRITSQQIFKVKELVEGYQDKSDQEYKTIKWELDQISISQSQSDKYMIEILNILKKLIKNDSDSIISSQYKSQEYNDSINNALFLEKEQPDKKIASLKDVYIPNTYEPLDFSYSSINEEDDIIHFLQGFISNTLIMEKNGTRYRFDTDYIYVLFIKGFPGSGKSSLFYYLANKKAYDASFLPKYNFHFIKLMSLYNALNKKLSVDNPIDDIARYIGNDNAIDSRTVIVLDGLDEICVARDVDIQAYCHNMIDDAATRKIKIIITTRMNYINISYTDNKNVINVHLINLTIGQLDNWNTKYFSIHDTLLLQKECAEKNIEYMKKHKNDMLVNIFAVPLLFYMIVATQIDISKVKSIGELYDRVFEELQIRNYDESKEDMLQRPRVSRKIPGKMARRIAMEISYKMYGMNQLLLKAHSEELQNALEAAESTDHSFKEEDKTEIEHLFPITFYYKDSVDVVEFAHKSIMEFFTAEKLFDVIEKYRKNFDLYVSDFVVNPIIITHEVLDFFTYFASKPENKNLLKSLFPDFQKTFRGMIISKKIFENTNIMYPFETTIVVFKYYWYFLRNILNEDITKINEILDDEIVKKYITCTLSIIDSNSLPFLDNAVSPYDFSNLSYNEYHFVHCHLDYCTFDNSEMKDCVFRYSDLMGTLLRNLKIVECITFHSCDLTGAIIQGWKQSGKVEEEEAAYASFDGCILDAVSIQDMNITAIDFQSVLSMTGISIKKTTMSKEQFLLFARNQVQLERITIEMKDHEMNGIERSSEGLNVEAIKQRIIADNEREQLFRIERSYLEKMLKKVNFIISPSDKPRHYKKNVSFRL